MRISLNLATRPYADLGPALKRLRIAMGVLFLLGCGLLLGLRAVHQKAEDARASEQSVQNKIDAIERERHGYQEMMRQPANAELLVQAGMLNQLIDEKTFSWTLAMEDLETVLPGGVQVTSLDPSRDPKTGRITLKLRVIGARDRADDLVEQLEHSKHFLMPHIVQESSETSGGFSDRMEPVSASNRFNFELLAEYNPVAPAERKAEKKQEEKEKPAAGEEKPTVAVRPMATGKHAGPSAPPPRAILPVPPTGYPMQQPGRPPYGQPFRPGANQNRVPNPVQNTGGQR